MLVERTLRAEAEKLSSVNLNFGTSVTAVSDEGDYVTATYQQAGADKEIRARYLIGCDGPRSLVRKHLGIEYTGETGVIRDFMGGVMHAIYFRSPGLYDDLADQKAWM